MLYWTGNVFDEVISITDTLTILYKYIYISWFGTRKKLRKKSQNTKEFFTTLPEIWEYFHLFVNRSYQELGLEFYACVPQIFQCNEKDHFNSICL